MRNKVLFVSHDASRTGAPLMLLDIIKWFKKSSPIEFVILVSKEGVLVEEFEKLGKTFILNNADPDAADFKEVLKFRIKKKYLLPTKKKKLRKALQEENIGLVYANTIATGNLYADILMDLDAKLITHIHELEIVIRNFGAHNLKVVMDNTDFFITASTAVKDNLILNHALPSEKIEVIHSFVNTDAFKQNSITLDKNELLKSLNIDPDNSFVVGASGNIIIRKGVDVFIQLARAVKVLNPSKPVYFIWVGADVNAKIYKWMAYDLQKLGLSDDVKFIPVVKNPVNYFQLFDTFVMVSREDPFPLVCLENASLGHPIICFAGAGGIPEFVENDAGFVVPYLDVSTMAKKIMALMDNPEDMAVKGKVAAEKVRTMFDVSVLAPKILSVINKVMKE